LEVGGYYENENGGISGARWVDEKCLRNSGPFQWVAGLVNGCSKVSCRVVQEGCLRNI